MKAPTNSYLSQLRVLFAYRDLVRNHVGFVSKRYFERFRQAQLAAARKLIGKERLEVAFLLTIPGMWKSDEVFKAMLKDDRYHPFVVIYPYEIYKSFDKEEVQRTLERTRHFIEQKGFEYLIPYDQGKRQWLDLEQVAKPDIVFFSTPYKDSYPKYYVDHFRDTFTCYVPYGFSSLNLYQINYDLFFHNLVGMHFVETELHRKMAMEHSRNRAENIVVTGYPAPEVFLRQDYVPRDLWKPQSHPKKKVIFAPHHTIDQEQYPSVFLEVCDQMLELAERYRDTIQFVFKPHQVLKFKLQQRWGVEQTEAYYQRWDRLENTQLVSDGYEDLFLTSDALIHDCGSFTTEYLFVRKPVMYLCGDADMSGKFNEFGRHAFNCHYHGRTADDIDRFLQEVVLDGVDPMQPQREQFFQEHLRPNDGLLPSQKVLQSIEQMMDGGLEVPKTTNP